MCDWVFGLSLLDWRYDMEEPKDTITYVERARLIVIRILKAFMEPHRWEYHIHFAELTSGFVPKSVRQKLIIARAYFTVKYTKKTPAAFMDWFRNFKGKHHVSAVYVLAMYYAKVGNVEAAIKGLELCLCVKDDFRRDAIVCSMFDCYLHVEDVEQAYECSLQISDVATRVARLKLLGSRGEDEIESIFAL